MAKQIIIDHVFKVFGDEPELALKLVEQGVSKQDIMTRTGNSIGVFDASLTIEAGEIFVVMGLPAPEIDAGATDQPADRADIRPHHD